MSLLNGAVVSFQAARRAEIARQHVEHVAVERNAESKNDQAKNRKRDHAKPQISAALRNSSGDELANLHTKSEHDRRCSVRKIQETAVCKPPRRSGDRRSLNRRASKPQKKRFRAGGVSDRLSILRLNDFL